MSGPVCASGGARSALKLEAAIAALGLTTSPVYAPGGGLTWCNKFVADWAQGMGVELPFMLANDQVDWLDGPAGRAAGWREVNEHLAGTAAELGKPVVVGWKNPAPRGHGHIAVLRSRGRIAQAGRDNFNDGPVARGFGARPVRYFANE